MSSLSLPSLPAALPSASGRLKRILVAGALGGAALAPLFVPVYELNLLARFLSLSILAMGLVVLWGEGGILSLGQGVFFGLGGYVLAIHMKLDSLPKGELPDFMMWSGVEHLPWWWEPFSNPVVAAIGVLAVPALLAACFAWLVFRRRIGGVYFSLITQALALAFATWLVSQQPTTGGFNGLTGFQSVFGVDLYSQGMDRWLYWITLALVVGAFAGARALMRSRYGMLLRATRDGQNRVRFFGYNPVPYKTLAFAFASMLAGVSGALFTLHAGVVSPALVGVVPSIEMVVWVAVGGRHSLLGVIVGTLFINFTKDMVSSSFPDFWLYGLGLTFVLVVTLLPNGIAGLTERLMARGKAEDAGGPFP